MKRIISMFICVLVLIMSIAVLPVCAQDTTSTDCIYFQVPTEPNTEWKNFSMIYCHIWQEGADSVDFYAWQSKNERCTNLENGYWSYDISGFEFKENESYSLIFSNENGQQTYNLTITSACKGDIVVCGDEICKNPVDSNKDCLVGRWLENGETVHPCAMLDSEGQIQDPDWIAEKDVDTTWGSSEGVSIAMPQVAVPTEAPTEKPTQKSTSSDEKIDSADNDDTDDDADKSSNNIIWYIVGGGVALVICAVVLVVAVKKNKSK